MANAVKIREQANDIEPVSGKMITPAEMIQSAIENGSGVEVMERLLALQERYDAYNARKAFDNAMADLRSNLPKIVKSRTVDFEGRNGGARTHYKFEDLAEITEALAEPMSAVGLSFRWYTDNADRGVKVTCRITHRDGHFEETSLVGPLDATGNKNPIQAIGSAVSYLQRYTLKAAVGVAAAHDDDAQSVNQQQQSAPASNPAPAPKSKADSRETYERLSKANRALDTEENFKKFWSQSNVQVAFENLPKDWRQTMGDERNEKRVELEERAAVQGDDFPGFADPNETLDRQYAETMRDN